MYLNKFINCHHSGVLTGITFFYTFLYVLMMSIHCKNAWLIILCFIYCICYQLRFYTHSKNEVVILTINLLCWSQISEPVSCMDTVNC